MSNYEVISQEAVSNSEALNLINKKAKDTELTYREEKTQETLKKMNKMTETNFKKAAAELKALEIPRLEDTHIIKILDTMPANGTVLRAIVSHSGTVLVDESVTSILDVVKKYAK